MALSDIVNVTITAQTSAPTRVGFGTPLLMGYHTNYDPGELFRIYTSVDDMLTDGFSANDSLVRMATAVLSQNPKVGRVIVGVELNTEKQKIKITPTAVDSKTYEVTINGTVYRYVSDASATVAEITAGLEAAIDAAAWAGTTGYVVGDHVANDTSPVKVYRCTVAGTSAGAGGPTGTGSGIVDGTVTWAYVGSDQPVAATDNTTDLDVEGDAVADQFYYLVNDRALLATESTTIDGSPDGIVDDLTKLRIQNDDWYALLLTDASRLRAKAAAAYIETLEKVMIISSADDAIYDGGSSTDIAAELSALNYARTALMYHGSASQLYPAAAWAGKNLPKDPGSITWKFKSMAGVTASTLTTTEIAAIEAKNTNHYTTVAGLDITQQGVTVSGEYLDVTRGVDFIRARLREEIFAALANADKVPFTDPGIQLVEGIVYSVLNLSVGQGILAADPAPTVTVPLAADVSTIDKANRLLPDVEFAGTLAGAIHAVEVTGVVSL